jgi:hypothetical protein
MLTPTERDKLLKLLRLLGSDRIGERAAAGFMAHRIIQSAGLDWGNVIAAPAVPYTPPPMPYLEADRRRRAERERIASRSWARDLTDAEIDVVIVYAATDQPTEAQERIMQRILSKIAKS